MMANTPPKKNRFKRQNVEFQLRERERFLRTLISNLPGVVFRCRTDENFTKEFLSDGCFKLTGYRPEMLIGADATQTWNDLVHPEDRARIEAELHRLIERENEPPLDSHQFKITYRIITRDAQVRQVRERFQFVRDAHGKIIALEGFINDITERALAKDRVRESEARYRLLAENMRDLVCLHELDGKWSYVSPSSVAMLGYSPDELIGMSPAVLLHPEDRERVRDEAYEPLMSGKTDSLVVESRMHDKRGDYYWFETMAQTVRNPEGVTVQLQTVSRDITVRKEAEAEREKIQEDLARLLFSEKEARQEAEAARVEVEHASRVKDEFLQMVSHEFRTPLTTIKTLVRVLQHNGGTKAEREQHLLTIASECDRQVDMILNLLDVSRFEEGDVDLKREPVDVDRVLQSCEKIERPAADAREQIFNIQYSTDLPPICGDEKAIRRALCTIIENAIKYTPEGGMINITPRHITRLKAKLYDESDRVIAAKLFGDLPKQMDFSDGGTPVVEEIAIVICDTGRGILPEDVPRIFQKFFRGAKPFADSSTDGTPDDAAGKAETPGVGLGLYLAKRLITALEGRINVNSDPGRGSCFTVFLPVWNENLSERDTIDEYDYDEGGAQQ